MDIGKVGESIRDLNGLPERPGWPQITIIREKYPSAGVQVNLTAKSDMVNHNCTIAVLKRGGDSLGNLLLNGLASRMAVIFRKKKLDTFVGNNVNRLKMCLDRA